MTFFSVMGIIFCVIIVIACIVLGAAKLFSSGNSNPFE